MLRPDVTVTEVIFVVLNVEAAVAVVVAASAVVATGAVSTATNVGGNDSVSASSQFIVERNVKPSITQEVNSELFCKRS